VLRSQIKPTGGPRKCTYDACTQDTDCAGSGVCGCALGFAGQNVCLANSTCRINTDCASGERCVLSRPFSLSPRQMGLFAIPVETGAEIVPQGFGLTTAFNESLGNFCTTGSDSCGGSQGPGTCVYDADAGHWDWGYAP
jgi:hypothetical protein